MKRRRFKRLLAIALLVGGSGIAAAGVASLWLELSWWSAVRGLGTGPYQRFLIVERGVLSVGTRGTSGFFNRKIFAAGLTLERLRGTVTEPRARRWLPMLLTGSQVSGCSIPLIPSGLLAAGCGACLRGRRVRPGRCGVCGYDLSGLSGGPCPECGTLPPA
jgi:hypothetical protein